MNSWFFFYLHDTFYPEVNILKIIELITLKASGPRKHTIVIMIGNMREFTILQLITRYIIDIALQRMGSQKCGRKDFRDLGQSMVIS